MNKLYIGVEKMVEMPKGGFFFIDDEVEKGRWEKVFNPLKHSFNALEGMDYKKARDLASLIYGLSPQGENTLTVRNGKRALVTLLLKADRLDKLGSPTNDAEKEALGMVEDLLISPVLRRVLCGKGEKFALSPDARILARVNRAELGEFDAKAIGQFLIGQYKGQVVVPDFGFYMSDSHMSLIRQERLMCGVNFLDELSPKLRQAVLLIKDKVASGCTFEDAKLLARFARMDEGTVGFNEFVSRAVS